ncbi:hypothetical protein FA10DRAFT_289136 [Acaromyces ingoldii]|uniref:Uncharacterized protein n=1 Tax=Acaromyces ingoldii TaxID=215250 RepID=A0A316YH35_9BASI|nr:hypothetical protein FA10DRAFT_289136 [Acaromyces ingoldii]PWN87055.1 hypothetical protein FA10DRAFT_289136 [Acaromyces ingoldii]
MLDHSDGEEHLSAGSTESQATPRGLSSTLWSNDFDGRSSPPSGSSSATTPKAARATLFSDTDWQSISQSPVFMSGCLSASGLDLDSLDDFKPELLSTLTLFPSSSQASSSSSTVPVANVASSTSSSSSSSSTSCPVSSAWHAEEARKGVKSSQGNRKQQMNSLSLNFERTDVACGEIGVSLAAISPYGASHFHSMAPSSPLRSPSRVMGRLPLHLPRPQLAVISTPYDHLPEHLRRHGLHQEAADFAKASGITPEYAIHAWVQVIDGGREALLEETKTLLNRHEGTTKQQMARSRAEGDAGLRTSLPMMIRIPTHETDSRKWGIESTHILAVCRNDGQQTSNSESGVLIPCHALVYVLQCASLPAFPASVRDDAAPLGSPLGQGRLLPVVPLRAPEPQHFVLTHRFLYLCDEDKFLCDLLPMKHIARSWDRVRQEAFQQPLPPSPPPLPSASPGSFPLSSTQEAQRSKTLLLDSEEQNAPLATVDALSSLPICKLLDYCNIVHAAWANGVAIGLLDTRYWATLDRAWGFLVAALSLRQAKENDAKVKTAAKQKGKEKG